MRKLSILLIITTVMFTISCKSGRKSGENPFFSTWETPYGMPPFNEIEPKHYKEALLHAVELHLAEIEAIIGNEEAPNFENTVLALDNSGEMYGDVSTVFSYVTAADTNDELQRVKSELSPIMTKHMDDIYLNSELYNKVHAVYDALIAEVIHARMQLDADEQHKQKMAAQALVEVQTNAVEGDTTVVNEVVATPKTDPKELERWQTTILQGRLADRTHKRFILAGAHLNQEKKGVLREINEKLSLAELQFANNILAENKTFKMVVDTADVVNLPSAIRDAAATEAEKAGEKGRYAFTLSRPSLFPFLTNSSRRDLREKLYKGYLERCNHDDETDNKSVINDIVSLRTERAKLLGFDTHADYVLEDRMAKSPNDVYGLLDGLWEPALNSAKAELEAMKAIKMVDTGSDDFESWDWWYYAEKVRKQKFALDEEMLKPYFSLPNVQAGIFDLSNRLFGMTFRPVNNAPVYNKECSVFEVFDADNKHMGVLIMDFFPRDGKRVGAWCGSYRVRKYKDGVKSDPIVTVVCNFTRPQGSRPALLSLEEVETFFHEFGHAIHGLCTDVPYKGLIRVERDFVELPSQLLENWAFQPQMLRRYAMHYSSNSVIPNHLIEKIQNSTYFNQGFVTVEYLAASYSDMDIYTTKHEGEINVNGFEAQMLSVKRRLIPQIAPRYHYPYFSHVFSGGYSAGYYSYIWSEVMVHDAFEAFLESGDIFNHQLAQSYRKNILDPGGSEDGITLYRNFRGKDAAREPLLYARGLMERPPRMADDNNMEEDPQMGGQ